MHNYKITTIDGTWTVQADNLRHALSMQGFYVPLTVTRVGK